MDRIETKEHHHVQEPAPLTSETGNERVGITAEGDRATIAGGCREAVMSKISAGLLMYRFRDGQLQVLLVHPGGPFFKNKDEGAWSIPKGEAEPEEDLLVAARREFEEEIGIGPTGPFFALTPVKQKGGKTVHAWAFEGDCDPTAIVSNTFTMAWPPNSGQQQELPEVDRAEFFDPATAKKKINAGQVSLIDELEGDRGSFNVP